MKRISILLIFFMLLVLPVAAQTKVKAKDIEAVKNIALKWQDGWNRHDIKSLAAFMAEDIDFVTVSGSWQKSPKEFEEYYTKRHEMQYRESIFTMKSSKVKLIKPDVAIAHVEWGMNGDKDPDGTRRPPRQGIYTWILEKRKGKWLIIAAQNTNLREPVPSK